MPEALRKPEYEDLNKQFLELFTATRGVHCILQKKGKIVHEDFTKEPAKQRYMGRENMFMSYNTCKKHERTKPNVCALSAIVMDLDIRNVGMNKAGALFLLPELLDDENIPKPTAVVDSGNGLYLLWKLERTKEADEEETEAQKGQKEQVVNNPAMVRLYEKITKKLQKKLESMGADPQSCDVLHLFRMPGTINTKWRQRNEVTVLRLNPDQIYDLDFFATEILDELPKSRKKAPKTKKKGSIQRLFNPYTLAVARKKDLEQLVQMREYEMDGCRHSFLHIYAVQLMQAGAEDYEKKLSEMNALLTRPIHENEVQALIKTLNQKAENGARIIKAIEAAKKPTDKPMKAVEKTQEISYAYHNTKIIDNLKISESEQASMRTIIGGAERGKRNRLRKQKDYAPVKAANQTQKEQRDERIVELKNAGCTNNEIIAKMKDEGYKKVSVPTIKRVMRTRSE